MTDTLPTPFFVCAICGEPCELETCKTDEEGMAVHGEYFVRRMASPQSTKRQAPKRFSENPDQRKDDLA